MKKKALKKEFWVEIKNSLPRFLSILMIVALGVAFFAGIRSTKPDMEISADRLYDERNFMDIRILGTMGLSDGDIEAVKAVEGIMDAEGAYSRDVLVKTGEKQLVIKMMSLPAQINRISVKEGRIPGSEDECIVDEVFLETTGYQVGDSITVASGGEDDIKDSLARTVYTITGSCTTPYYLSMTRGNSMIGNGKVDNFIMVPAEAFTMDVYTEMYAVVDGAAELLCYSDAYEDKVGSVIDVIEDTVRPGREQARYDEVKKKAEEELEEAESELADGERTADKELKDARDKLDDARKELEDGRKEIADNEQKLADAQDEYDAGSKKIEEAKTEIAANEKKLEDSEAVLKQSRIDYEAGREAYDSGKEKYDAGMKQLKEAKNKLDQSEEVLKAAREGLKTALAGIDAREAAGQITAEQAAAMRSGLSDQEMELKAGEKKLEEGKKEYEANERTLTESGTRLKDTKAELDAANKKLIAGEKELKDGRQALKDGKKELAEKEQELKDAKEEIENGYEELESAKDKLEQGEADYKQGEADYEEAGKDAEEELADGRQKIEDARKEIEEIKQPEWYVLDRNSIQTYVEYGQDAERIGAIGDVFPIIFFLVAALVSLTTMTRMVEEQRTQIGTLKALGYGRYPIAMKYIKYAFGATLCGSILGGAAGCIVLPSVIISAYRILYRHLEYIETPFNYGYVLLAAGIALGCVLAATAAACYRELRSSPAQLMRPASPKQGKRVLLERIPLIWKHLNFTKKATVRNLFRYKKRFFMTIFGIGGCMALMLVGFGLKDSIFSIVNLQFNEVQVYDAILELNGDADAQEKEELEAYLNGDERISGYKYQYHKSCDAVSGAQEKQVYLNVVDQPEDMDHYVIFRNRKTGEQYHLTDDGVILTEKAARLMEVEVNDTIYIKDGDNRQVRVKIDAIAENYVYHNVFMTKTLYEELYGMPPEYNEIVLNGSQLTGEGEEKLAEDLLSLDGVTSITLTRAIQDRFSDIIGSLNVVILVLIISAGGLAFVVLYNLNNISINERKRELATLKVLGFYDLEVSEYVYRENVVLTFIGMILGIFLGILLHRYVIITCEIDMIMFGRNINAASYLYSALLTVLFALLINVSMHFKLKKVDMAASLKSVE